MAQNATPSDVSPVTDTRPITSPEELREVLGGVPAGQLIHVIDPGTVAVAERPGNKRADGYLNVLSNPHVGILSLIPGRQDTLRINGRAKLVRDAPFFSGLEVRGK